jgi:hypothetical protein
VGEVPVCPGCGRRVPLGQVTDGAGTVTDERLRCIDCHFGPPVEFWEQCPRCGELTPSAESCEACDARESEGTAPRPGGGCPGVALTVLLTIAILVMGIVIVWLIG